MAKKKNKVAVDFQKLRDYIKTIDLTKADGDSLVLSEEAEAVIDAFLEVEQFVKESKDKLKERFIEVAQKNPKLKKYEGDRVSVGYRMTRRKTVKGDPDKKFYTLEKKPNAKAIDAYREATGDLPTGIEEATYEYITFKKN